MTGIPLALFVVSAILSGVSSVMMMSGIKAARPDDSRFSWWRHPSPIDLCKVYLELYPYSWLPQIYVGSLASFILITVILAVRG